MKKIYILLLLFFYPMMSIAQIQAQPGDIVVFNAPLQIEKIRVQLFQCVSKQTPCPNWEPLGLASPVLNPAAYYIFKLNDKDKTRLAGNDINIKVYNVSEKQWSNRLTFITTYRDDEAPFYQFICLSRRGTTLHFACSNSDSLALQKSYLYTLISTFDSFLSFLR